MWFNSVVLTLLLTTTFTGDEYFQAGENDEGIIQLRFRRI